MDGYNFFPQSKTIYDNLTDNYKEMSHVDMDEFQSVDNEELSAAGEGSSMHKNQVEMTESEA